MNIIKKRKKLNISNGVKENLKRSKGISLIEVVIGVSVVFIALISVVTTYNFFLRMAQKNMKVVKVEFLLEEGVEALRSIRDLSWENFSGISTDTDHYLTFENGFWVATSTNTYIDNLFERKFVVNDVYRDGTDNISESGTLDEGTKKINVSVAWFDFGATSTRSTSIFLTNLFEE